MLVADAAEKGGFQAEAGGAHGDIGRTAANVFGKARHILQPAAGFAGRIDRRKPGRW